MSDDRERPDNHTDEDPASQRRVRFGHLPPRVRPDELVESEEAESLHEEPQQPMVRREWG
jgi:hypothetical protein